MVELGELEGMGNASALQGVSPRVWGLSWVSFGQALGGWILLLLQELNATAPPLSLSPLTRLRVGHDI